MAPLLLSSGMSPNLIRRLHALAEQRCAYYVELHESGRWRHYYSHDDLLAHMREVVKVARAWQDLIAATQPGAKKSAAPDEPTATAA
jgi:uncharacterized repeat protein (TIGR03809 family)